MTRLRSLALLACAASLLACEKNAVQEIDGPMPSARIKFYNFGLNAPSVNFYANDTKMSATSSTTGVESTTGVTYATGVSNGDRYSAIEPGQYTFRGKIAATVDKDLAISTVVATIEDGKHYSLFQAGPYNATTKTVDAFIIEDSFLEERDYTVAYVRFVNTIYNSNPMTLHVKHTVSLVETALNGPVAFKGATDFIAIPGGFYDISTRYTGSTTNAISRTGVSFVAGRIYTIAAKGDITITSTTATNRPLLDLTTNR